VVPAFARRNAARNCVCDRGQPGCPERRHATLAPVKAAEAMPWSDRLAIIREDNAVRLGNDLLPAVEGAALWAELDAEMNRLYAIMNQGKESDLGD
jgi:hypothetical protein